MMTDPIADMLTRIRNALRIRIEDVSIPHSKAKEALAVVLEREGYIGEHRVQGEGKHKVLIVDLKYGPDGEKIVTVIRRESRPGRRRYKKHDELPPILSGLGIQVISTSKGLKSDRECRKEKIGGEVLCTVY